MEYVDIWKRTRPAGPSLYVVQVLERGCRHPVLDGLLERYRTPVALTLDGGAVLTLNREYDHFSGDVQWCGTQSRLTLSTDTGNGETADGALAAWRELCAQQKLWDKKARICAAEQLLESANDWQKDDDEDAPPITADEFMRRIGEPDISVDGKGNLSFLYDDDEMFWGHVIFVEGTLTDGFTEATIAG